MAYDPRVLRALRENAEASGDPVTYIATAMTESNLDPTAIGDGGNSGGLFQENSRGRGAGIPMQQRLDPFANARRGAKEFRTFYDRGYRGPKLALAAQRPSDPAYTSKLQRNIPKARQLWAQMSGMPVSGAPKAQLPKQPSAPVTPEPPDLLSLAQAALPSRQGDDSLTRTMGRAFMMQQAMERNQPKAPAPVAAENAARPAAAAVPSGFKPGKFRTLGGPGQGTHTLGNWQSDMAYDFMGKTGQPVSLPWGAKIVKISGQPGGNPRFAGYGVTVQLADGGQLFLKHLGSLGENIKVGARVPPGTLIGTLDGTVQGGPHVHAGALSRPLLERLRGVLGSK